MNDFEVTRLRAGIKRVWKKLERTMGTSFKASTKKWELYFICERKVMDVVTQYLSERGIRYFTEHDGFRTSEPVNASELQAEIERETKFVMKLDAACAQ